MSNPTAEQKRWLADVADWADSYSAYPLCGPYQIHHVKGRSYKHNKSHIGHWYILPIITHLHDISSNNIRNVTFFPREFEKEHGTQKSLFIKMVNDMRERGYNVPPEPVLNVIKTVPSSYVEGVDMDKIYRVKE